MSRPLVSPRLQWLQSRDKRAPDLGEPVSARVVVDDSHLAKLPSAGCSASPDWCRTPPEVRRNVNGSPRSSHSSAPRLSLQQHCTVDDELWADLTAHHGDEAILELLMLAGTYRTVSYLVNGLRLPPEPGACRFPG